MNTAPMNTDNCIAKCLECLKSCRDTLAHCIRLAGPKGGPMLSGPHVAALLDCIDCCNCCLGCCARSSAVMKACCAMCAAACTACAKACAKFDDITMTVCGNDCTECAQACQAMAK